MREMEAMRVVPRYFPTEYWTNTYPYAHWPWFKRLGRCCRESK
jgi:hypothetical protein